jgi:hypothetical protein
MEVNVGGGEREREGGEQWQNGCKCGGVMDMGMMEKNRCEC